MTVFPWRHKCLDLVKASGLQPAGAGIVPIGKLFCDTSLNTCRVSSQRAYMNFKMRGIVWNAHWFLASIDHSPPILRRLLMETWNMLARRTRRTAIFFCSSPGQGLTHRKVTCCRWESHGFSYGFSSDFKLFLLIICFHWRGTSSCKQSGFTYFC